LSEYECEFLIKENGDCGLKKVFMGLDTVELIVEIEKHFDIAIPDEEAECIATVEQLVDYVYTHQKSGYKIEKKAIDVIVIHLLSTLVGIPKEEVKLHHSFTDDLGMD